MNFYLNLKWEEYGRLRWWKNKKGDTRGKKCTCFFKVENNKPQLLDGSFFAGHISCFYRTCPIPSAVSILSKVYTEDMRVFVKSLDDLECSMNR